MASPELETLAALLRLPTGSLAALEALEPAELADLSEAVERSYRGHRQRLDAAVAASVVLRWLLPLLRGRSPA